MGNEKFIDVRRLIASKNPKLLKWMPRFILRYLERILHQDEINAFLDLHKNDLNADFCREVVNYFNIRIEVEGLENIPESGPVILAMNHPLGGMDAMALVTALDHRRKDLKFIVNDLLMNLSNLKELFVGVNKHGKNDLSLREQMNDLFASEKAVCVFPAGLVSRKIGGKVEDLEWKKTFITYARRNGQPVIPVYIDGELSSFFYRLSKIRKFLGIKANIEMLYLSDEMFRQRNKTIRFVIGEPLTINEMGAGNDKVLAEKMRTKVYQLRDASKN